MSRLGAILLEFEVSLPKGHATMKTLLCWLARQRGLLLPQALFIELQEAHDHYCYLNQRITVQDQKIKAWVEQDELCQLVKTIQGGDMVSSILAASVGDGRQFKNRRHMAAWMGLVPRQYSTSGRNTLLGISKRGNKRLRSLFVMAQRDCASSLERRNRPVQSMVGQVA